jgi:DNA primase
MDKKAKAKKVNIEDIMPEGWDGQKIGNKVRGLCPLHGDLHNPNFFIYLDTNSWFCFAGCGGGDVIGLYMKLNNVDFKTALEELTK